MKLCAKKYYKEKKDSSQKKTEDPEWSKDLDELRSKNRALQKEVLKKKKKNQRSQKSPKRKNHSQKNIKKKFEENKMKLNKKENQELMRKIYLLD